MICPHCNATIPDDVKFCPECGKPVSEQPVHQKVPMTAAEKPKKEKKKGSCLVTGLKVIGVLFALFLGLSIITNSGSSNPDINQPHLTDEEFISICEEYDYDDIARNPDNYKGKHAVFTGQVIQVQESGKHVVMRVNVTKGEFDIYTDTVYVEYERKSDDEPRVLDWDIITMYGSMNGIKKYTAVFGNQVTIPSFIARIVEIEK